jgi:putative hydrolase
MVGGSAVSDPSPFAGGPLGDLLRNLAKLLTAQGPLNWDVARQLAAWTATEGRAEPNPDPLTRLKMEELLRVADMHVAEATGMATSRRGWLSVVTVTRTDWASKTLQSWRPVLLQLASSLSSGAEPGTQVGGTQVGGTQLGGPSSDDDPGPGGQDNPMDQLLGNLPQVIGPLVLGAQAGAMVGHLASRAMGQYDMPMPAPSVDELMAVTDAIDGFAKEWGLAADDVRMYVCLRDVTHHAVLVRPHVAKVLEDHLIAYANAFHVPMDVIEQRLGNLDPNDLMSFQESLGDPESLFGEIQSEEQRRLLVPFRAFLAALAGYTDFILDKVGQRLVGSYPLISEAFRRRRLEDGPGQRVLGKLLGIELDQETVDRGHAFVSGVVERAGEEGLSGLWVSAASLPTPAEVDAPGLWLARTEFLD